MGIWPGVWVGFNQSVGDFNRTEAQCTFRIYGVAGSTIKTWNEALKLVKYRNTLSEPSGVPRQIVLGIWDSGVSFWRGNQYTSVAYSLFMHLWNDPPGLAIAPAPTAPCDGVQWTEKDRAVALFPWGINATDGERRIANSTIQLVNGTCRLGDVLAYDQTLATGNLSLAATNLTLEYSASLCTLTLSGWSTPATYSAALSGVRYSNEALWVNSTQRAVLVTVWDWYTGDNSSAITNSPVYSAQARTLINLTTWDDTPLIAVAPPTLLTYREHDPWLAWPALPVSLTDVDSLYVQGMRISIISGCNEGDSLWLVANATSQGTNITAEPWVPLVRTGNVLDAAASAAYSVSALGSTGVSVDTSPACTLDLVGIASLAQYAAALQAVRFGNRQENPGRQDRVLNITVQQYTDVELGIVRLNANATSAAASFTIRYLDVNDAPVLSIAAGEFLDYTEQQDAGVIAPSLQIYDPEQDFMQQATARITTACAEGDTLALLPSSVSQNLTLHAYRPLGQTLAVAPALNTSDGSGQPCSLTLTGRARISEYVEALAHVTYRNGLDNPSFATRTVTFYVTDMPPARTGYEGNWTSSVSTTVRFTAVNDPPVLVSGNQVWYIENAPVALDPTLLLTDPEDDPISNATVRISAGCQAGDVLYPTVVLPEPLVWSYSSCSLTITGQGNTTAYSTVLRALWFNNTINNPVAGTRTVTWSVTDNARTGGNGNLTSAANSLVYFQQVNDPPVLVCSGTVPYSQGQGAVALAPALALTDWEGDLIGGANVTITANCYEGDVLALDSAAAAGVNLTIVSYTGPTPAAGCTACSIGVTGPASTATYQALLRQITFVSTSLNSSAITRSVTFTASDMATTGSSGNLTSPCYTRVAFTLINDPPAVLPSGYSRAYVEQAEWLDLDPAIQFTDPESDNLTTAVVTITGACSAGDELRYAGMLLNASAYRDSTDATQPCTLRITGNATLLTWGLEMRKVQFRNLLDDASNATRIITVTVTDGPVTGSNGPLTGTATITVFFTNVNDAPQIWSGPLTLVFIEDSPQTLLSAGLGGPLVLVDADDSNATSASVLFVAGYYCDEDWLNVTVLPAGVSQSWSCPTLTLNGTAPLSSYQAALRSITYRNSNLAAPRTGARQVRFAVVDAARTGSQGLFSSAYGLNSSAVVTVSPRNDVPSILALQGDAVVYSEEDAPVPLDTPPYAAVADDDMGADLSTPDISSIQVRITGGYVASEDELRLDSTRCAAGLSAAWDSVTGTLLITRPGNASNITVPTAWASGGTNMSLAQAATALASVVYVNTNGRDPTAGARTVTWRVTDDGLLLPGPLASPFVTTTVTIVPRNDPPVITISNSSTAFTEDGPPITVDSVLTLTDVDDSQGLRARVAIVGGTYVSTEDVLALPASASYPGITSTWRSDEGVLYLHGVGAAVPMGEPSSPAAAVSQRVTRAQFQAAMAAVTYNNVNGLTPFLHNRTVRFSYLDAAESEPGAWKWAVVGPNRTVVIIPRNDAPVWRQAALPAQVVPENTPAGTVLVDFSARAQAALAPAWVGERDTADVLTWAITGGNTGFYWALKDNTSCVLVVNATVLDYELGVRSFVLSITVTDSNAAGDPVGRLSATATLAVTVSDVDEAPSVTALPSYTMQEQEESNALEPEWSQAGTVQVWDWDITDRDMHFVRITALDPPDGHALLRGRNASELFLLVLTNSTVSTTPSATSQPRAGYTLRAQVLLSTILAKAITLRLQAVETNRPVSTALVSNTLTTTLYIVRANGQVEWSTGSVSLALNENSPIGTVVTAAAPLQALDRDTNQVLAYSIIYSSAESRLPGLFTLQPVPGWPVSDAATGWTGRPSRMAHIVVARDALDYELLGVDRTIILTIRVQDDASFNNSRLPRVLPTAADINVTIELVDLPDNEPFLAAVAGVPQAGLSTQGGTRLTFTGANLGLPDGPAAAVFVQYSNGNYTWEAVSCVVTVRLTEVQCLSVDGFGEGYGWRLQISRSGNWSAFTVQVSDYARPIVLSFSPVDAPTLATVIPFTALGMVDTTALHYCNGDGYGNFTVEACTWGTRRVLVHGFNFPSLAQGPAALGIVRYGLTGTEYTAKGCTVWRDYTQLLCYLAPGVGDNLRWTVTVGNLTSAIPTTGFGTPVILNVTVMPDVADGVLGAEVGMNTEGGTRVVIEGYNFGLVSEQQSSLVWVQHVPTVQSSPAYPWLSLTGQACNITQDHVRIECFAAPGYGVGFTWRVNIAGQVSEWSSVLASYARPRLDSITPSVLKADGGELLRMQGYSLGAYRVAMVDYSGYDVPRDKVIYASHYDMWVRSLPGIGANKTMTVTVGDAVTRVNRTVFNATTNETVTVTEQTMQTATIPFSYEVPTVIGFQWTDGEGGPTRPMRLNFTGSGFGRCCNCLRYPDRCKVTEQQPTSEIIAMLQAECPVTSCNRPDGTPFDEPLRVLRDGVDVKAILRVADTWVFFELIDTKGNITFNVGGQLSASTPFDRELLLGNLPQISGHTVLSPLNAVLGDDKKVPTAGQNATMVLSGIQFQKIGEVRWRNQMGEIRCPSVFSTEVVNVKDLVAVETTYGMADDETSPVFPFYNITSGEIIPAAQVRNDNEGRVGANFTVPPMASLTTINETEYWVERPLLCHVVRWFKDPRATVTAGSITFTVPPGQGSVRVYVFARGVNLQSKVAYPVDYFDPQVVLASPDNGPTYGRNITLTTVNAPPRYSLLDVWGPYLEGVAIVANPPPDVDPETSEAAKPLGATARNIRPELAPVNKVMFRLSDSDQRPVECRILDPSLWSDTSITCFSPEGVPGADYQIFLQAGIPGQAPKDYTDTGKKEAFDYHPGVVWQEDPPQSARTLGSSIVTFRGYSLGRSTRSRTVSVKETVSSTGFVSLTEDLNGDEPELVIVEAGGVVGAGGVEQGLVSGQVVKQPISVLSHTHDQITVLTRPGVGLIGFIFMFRMTTGSGRTAQTGIGEPQRARSGPVNATEGTNAEIQFQYARPVITSISSQYNPCYGLNDNEVRDDFWAANGQPTTPENTVNKTYKGFSTPFYTCIRAVQLFGIPRSPDYNPAEYRTALPPGFLGDVITIEGYNFGTTGTMAGVSITIENVICGDNAGGTSPIWTHDGKLVCTMARHLPLRDVSITIKVAKTIITSDDYGFRVRSMCPFQMFGGSETENVGNGTIARFCEPCYEGALCVGGDALPRSIAGYWKTVKEEWLARGLDDVTPAAFVPCPFGRACTPNQTCLPGHKGFMCTECEKGFAGGYQKDCKPCVNNDANYGLVVLAVLAACIFGAILIRRAMARRSKLVIVGKMMINFLQMTSALRVYLSAEKAPSNVKDFIDFAALANYVSLDFQSMQCATNFNYFLSFGMYMAIPVLTAVIPALVLFLYATLNAIVTGRRIDFSRIKRTTITAVGVLLFFVHNSVVVQILRVWNCTPPALGGYLILQPEISCRSDGYRIVQRVVAPVMGVLYGFGIPLMGVALLYSVRTSMASRRTLKYYGFMYDGFDVKGGKWFWEAVIMLRKLAFVGLGIMISSENLQVILGLFLVLLVATAHLQVQPFAEKALNDLETVALIGNMCMYFGILINDLIRTDKLPSKIVLPGMQPYESNLVLGWVIIFTQAIVLLRFGMVFAAIIYQNYVQSSADSKAKDEQRRLRKFGSHTTHKAFGGGVDKQQVTIGRDGLAIAPNLSQRAVRHGEMQGKRLKDSIAMRTFLAAAVFEDGEDRRLWVRDTVAFAMSERERNLAGAAVLARKRPGRRALDEDDDAGSEDTDYDDRDEGKLADIMAPYAGAQRAVMEGISRGAHALAHAAHLDALLPQGQDTGTLTRRPVEGDLVYTRSYGTQPDFDVGKDPAYFHGRVVTARVACSNHAAFLSEEEREELMLLLKPGQSMLALDDELQVSKRSILSGGARQPLEHDHDPFDLDRWGGGGGVRSNSDSDGDEEGGLTDDEWMGPKKKGVTRMNPLRGDARSKWSKLQAAVTGGASGESLGLQREGGTHGPTLLERLKAGKQATSRQSRGGLFDDEEDVDGMMMMGGKGGRSAFSSRDMGAVQDGDLNPLWKHLTAQAQGGSQQANAGRRGPRLASITVDAARSRGMGMGVDGLGKKGGFLSASGATWEGHKAGKALQVESKGAAAHLLDEEDEGTFVARNPMHALLKAKSRAGVGMGAAQSQAAATSAGSAGPGSSSLSTSADPWTADMPLGADTAAHALFDGDGHVPTVVNPLARLPVGRGRKGGPSALSSSDPIAGSSATSGSVANPLSVLDDVLADEGASSSGLAALKRGKSMAAPPAAQASPADASAAKAKGGAGVGKQLEALETMRRAKEEQARRAWEAEQARLEAERRAQAHAEEQVRMAAEAAAREAAARAEKERREEAERQRVAKILAEHAEAERRRAQAEAEEAERRRRAAEAVARIEAERRAKEEAAKARAADIASVTKGLTLRSVAATSSSGSSAGGSTGGGSKGSKVGLLAQRLAEKEKEASGGSSDLLDDAPMPVAASSSSAAAPTVSTLVPGKGGKGGPLPSAAAPATSTGGSELKGVLAMRAKGASVIAGGGDGGGLFAEAPSPAGAFAVSLAPSVSAPAAGSPAVGGPKASPALRLRALAQGQGQAAQHGLLDDLEADTPAVDVAPSGSKSGLGKKAVPAVARGASGVEAQEEEVELFASAPAAPSKMPVSAVSKAPSPPKEGSKAEAGSGAASKLAALRQPAAAASPPAPASSKDRLRARTESKTEGDKGLLDDDLFAGAPAAPASTGLSVREGEVRSNPLAQARPGGGKAAQPLDLDFEDM